jgi:putative inorganic carbon (hco3(-)) transporter
MAGAPRPIALSGLSRGELPALRAVDVMRFALLVLVVANLGRLPVLDTGGREAPILLNDVAVGIVLGSGFIAACVARRLVLDRLAAYAFGFALVGAASAVVSSRQYELTSFELLVSLAYLARWLFYFALYVVTVNVARSADTAGLRSALERTVMIFAAFGIVQAIFLPNFAQILYPDSRVVHDWDVQGHRLVSTLLDPNFAGMLIIMGLLLQIARMAAGRRVPGWQPLLLFVALLLTASRSSVLALFAGGAVILAVRGVSRRVLRAMVAAGALTVLGLPLLIVYANAYNKLTIDASALGRVVMWWRGLLIIAEHPWIGIGFNTFGFVQERLGAGWERLGANTYSIEGGLLFVTVMTGVVGLAFFLLMLKLVFSRCRMIWRSAEIDSESWTLSVGTAAITAALLVHSCFTNSLFLPYLMEPLWILWGLVSVTQRELFDSRAMLKHR